MPKIRQKCLVNALIAVHPAQAAMIQGLRYGTINLETDSLRDIGNKIGKEGGIKRNAPQQVKHHLQQLVKLGIVQIIHGEYTYAYPVIQSRKSK